MGPGQPRPPGPGNPRLRVHDLQRPERPLLLVGEPAVPQPRLALGRHASRGRQRLVTARLGHGQREPGPARLAGRAALRRPPDRGPRCPGHLDEDGPGHPAGECPGGRRRAHRADHHHPRRRRDAGPDRPPPDGGGGLRAARVRRKYCPVQRGYRRPGLGGGDPARDGPDGHGRAAVRRRRGGLVPAGGDALPGRLVQQRGGARRGVQRAGRPEHRDPGQLVARLAPAGGEPGRLVADQQQDRAGQVDVRGVARAALVGADDRNRGPAAAQGARPVQDRPVRRGPDHGQREQRAGAGPDRPGIVDVGRVPGDDDPGRAEGIGRPDQGADVARARRAVEHHGQQARPGRDAAQLVARQRDDGQQLRGTVVLAAQLGHELGRHRDRRDAGRLLRLARPPGQLDVRVVQQLPDRPAVRDRERDGPDALDHELAAALALGPVAQQRRPFLEPRAAARDPHAGYWLNATLVALICPTMPDDVTDTFWMVRPKGSFGMLKLKLRIGPSTSAGRHALATNSNLSYSPLPRVPRQVALPEATTRSTLALTSSGPAAERCRPLLATSWRAGPSSLVTVEDSEPKEIRTVPETWPMVPLLNPLFRWMLFATALTAVISTGPSGTSLALSRTWCRSWLAPWVRKGDPSRVTYGFFGNPCFWICEAATFCATAFATKSAATSRITSTTTPMTRLRRHPPRRRRGACAPGP